MGVVTDMDVLLEMRGEPKIGGSVGGFIALVVSLILVIVVACTAIFFLLRHDSSEGARRQRPYQHQPVPSSSSYTYHSSSTPSKSWFASLQAMFTGAAGSGRYNPVRRAKVRDGWLQATGDEWDDNLPDDTHERLRNMGNGQYTAYSPAMDPPFHPPRSMVATKSTSTVHPDESRIPNRFVSPAESPGSSVHDLPPVEIISIPRSASPESVSAPQSPHSIHIEPQNTDRRDSGTSTSSGSKFVESL